MIRRRGSLHGAGQALIDDAYLCSDQTLTWLLSGPTCAGVLTSADCFCVYEAGATKAWLTGRTESKWVSALPAYSGRLRMLAAMNFSVYLERFIYELSTAGSASWNMSCSVRLNEKWL